MSKTRDTGFLANVIQVHDTGVRIMSGSNMLMAISSSGQVTITGELSGSDAANSLLLDGTGSLAFTTTSSFLVVSASQQQISSSLLQVSASYISLSGSYNTFSGSASTRITTISSSQQDISSSQQQISASLLNVIAVYATTGSNSFRANQSITGSLVVSSTITAQTLVVQTVTSSIVYSSGSNVFGCDLNSRQTFTGSVNITGSQTIFGNVGIGTDTPTDGQLVISKAAVASTYATHLALVSTLSYTDTSMGIDFINRGIGGDLSGRISVIREGSGTNYGMAFGTNLSNVYCQRLYISSCGCVGIGCNTPGYTLDVKGSGHFTSAGTTMLIESTQPTNSHTLKIVQCADGGNANTDQGLVVQINGADGTSNIANFYDYNNGTAISRVRFLKNGITCFQNTVCSPTFAGSAVRGSSNLDLNGNSGYLTLRTGDTTRLFVGSTGGVSVGAVSDPGVNNFIVAGTICSAGQVKGSSLFAGGPACGSGWRLGGSTYNTAYESDGLWGTNSTPNFIQSPTGLGMRIGYTDNGSGLYGAAYGFDVSYKDGLNNCIDYNAIIMRNSGQGTTPFRVTSYGNIYGVSKNFRIKHPIPSMNDTHYLIHTSIEGPQADLIYRGKVQLVNGKAEVNIDLASRMTDGTFEALCQDVQSYTTNESGWSLTKSYVIENILHIEAQDKTSHDTISWLVIGERKDDGIKNSAITDENGHVIVEELKPEEGL